MIEVRYDMMPNQLFEEYLKFLIGQFYKVLPIQESEPETLKNYLESLLVELIGNQNLIVKIRYDAQFQSLIGIIQYFIDNQCEHKVYKKEVFKCINIIKRLQEKYSYPKVGDLSE